MDKTPKKPVQFNYTQLKNKILTEYKTYKEFALAANMNYKTLSQKLNNYLLFTPIDMLRIAKVLNFNTDEYPKYFFQTAATPKVDLTVTHIKTKEDIIKDLYLITELIQENFIYNSDVLKLTAADKNTLYQIIQFCYSKVELLTNNKNTTPIGKDNAHLFNLDINNRRLVNKICNYWLEQHQEDSEENSDIETIESYTRK